MPSRMKGKPKSNVTDEDNENYEDRAAFTRDPEMEKDFLELCFREVERQGYRGMSLTKDSWTRLETEFNEKWNVKFAHKIFKNRYDYLRRDYDAWVKIIGLSGHGFCAATNSIHLPPDKWNDVIQQNPRAAKFRNSSLKYPDLMKGVFEKTLAKGSYAWSSSSSIPRPTNDNEDEDDQIAMEEDANDDNIDLNTSMNDDYFDGIRFTEDIGTPSEEEISRTRPSKAMSRRPNKRQQKVSSGEPIDVQILGILKEQIDEEKAAKGPSYNDVMVCLREIKSLGVISPEEYRQAKVLFCDKPELKIAFMDEPSVDDKVELLEGPSIVVYDEFRMDKQSFKNLCRYFRQKNWLFNSKHIDVEEKMAMFLSTISHNNRNRIIRHRFQHSGETVHKYFHEVLNAMMNFAREMIVPPDFTKPVENIRSHIGLREGAFIGAVGALDGTLIDANIPIDEQVPFRGRGQGNCYQNVMAICDFDMKFIYVMAGWEGIAHDSRVLNETLRDPVNNFPMPPPSK